VNGLIAVVGVITNNKRASGSFVGDNTIAVRLFSFSKRSGVRSLDKLGMTIKILSFRRKLPGGL
jgi:hypothetical protein